MCAPKANLKLRAIETSCRRLSSEAKLQFGDGQLIKKMKPTFRFQGFNSKTVWRSPRFKFPPLLVESRSAALLTGADLLQETSTLSLTLV